MTIINKLNLPLKVPIIPLCLRGHFWPDLTFCTTRDRNTKTVIVRRCTGIYSAPVSTNEGCARTPTSRPAPAETPDLRAEPSPHHCKHSPAKFMSCSPLHSRDKGIFTQLKVRECEAITRPRSGFPHGSGQGCAHLRRGLTLGTAQSGLAECVCSCLCPRELALCT